MTESFCLHNSTTFDLSIFQLHDERRFLFEENWLQNKLPRNSQFNMSPFHTYCISCFSCLTYVFKVICKSRLKDHRVSWRLTESHRGLQSLIGSERFRKSHSLTEPHQGSQRVSQSLTEFHRASQAHRQSHRVSDRFTVSLIGSHSFAEP